MQVIPLDGADRLWTLTGKTTRRGDAPVDPSRTHERRPERMRRISAAEVHALMTYDANARQKQVAVANHIDTYA